MSVDLGAGSASSTVWTCDLSAEYVRDQRGLPDLTMAGATTTRKDFLSILDFDAADLERCLELGAQLKAERSLGPAGADADALDGRHVALLFEKPSLRTRTTFEIAVRELGGETFMLQSAETLGQREDVADVARNLERWVHAVVIRTYLAAVDRAVRGGHPAPERHQRADRRTAPVPGDRRLPHAAGALGLRARPHGRVRRRRQQRRGVVRARGGDARRQRPRREPRRLPLPHAVVQQATGVARHGARLRLFSDAGRRRRRRRRGLHRHVDVDGPGSRGRPSAARSSRRIRSTRR